MEPRTRWAGIVLAVVALAMTRPALATVEYSEMMPMSDGVKLYTRILLPDDLGGPWPTLLARTPYASNGPDDLEQAMELLAGFGNAIVMQDTRGTGQSEGASEPFLTDRADGNEAIAWIVAQPWNDGRILMAGASALGIPAYLVAPGADPAMRCQMVAIATPDVYSYAAFQGGVLRQSDVTSWASWLGMNQIVPQIKDHRDCDAFWDPARVTGTGADVHAATLHAGGWFDVFQQGTIEAFKLYQQSSDAWVADHQRLVIGPWYHHGMGEASVGEFTLPATAKWDLLANALNWVNWCFQGWNDAVDAMPRVQYWVMGAIGEDGAPGNAWRAADDWPPFPTDDVPYHLAPDGRLDPADPAVDLDVVVPFDPKNPSPTVGGRNLAMAAGPRDQAPGVESRPDAVLFTTDVLAQPLEVTGRVKAHLWVRTSAPDADVAVRLTDVYPDGRSMLVMDGIARLSRRDGCEHAVDVVPDQPVEIDADLWSTSWIFNAGHRLRVIVTGSNYPRFELNPALAAGGAGDGQPVEIHVLAGPQTPSALWLPIPAPVPPEPDPTAEAVEPGAEGGEEAVVGEPQVPEDGDEATAVEAADVPDVSETPEAADPAGVDEASEDPGEATAEPPVGEEVAPDVPGPDVAEEAVAADASPVDDAATAGPETLAATSSGGCAAGGGRAGGGWALMLLCALPFLRRRPMDARARVE